MDLLLFRKVPPDVPVTSPDVGRFSKSFHSETQARQRSNGVGLKKIPSHPSHVKRAAPFRLITGRFIFRRKRSLEL